MKAAIHGGGTGLAWDDFFLAEEEAVKAEAGRFPGLVLDEDRAVRGPAEEAEAAG